jgi:hypothetical protein
MDRLRSSQKRVHIPLAEEVEMSFHEDMLRKWGELEVRPQYDEWLEGEVQRLQRELKYLLEEYVWDGEWPSDCVVDDARESVGLLQESGAAEEELSDE